MEMNFCRRCGTKLIEKSAHQYICDNGHDIFANTNPAVGVFIVDEHNNVTLSVRGIEPHKGMLDSFGGFVDGHESFEEAIAREMLEETGLTPDEYTRPIYLCSGFGLYPFGGETLPVLSAVYYAALKPGATIQPNDDVASTETYSIAAVPIDRLHEEDIVVGIQELQRVLGGRKE